MGDYSTSGKSVHYYDADEIRKALSVLKPNNELFEVRIVKGRKVFSGYFYQSETLIQELNKVSLEGANVYCTLHELHPGCAARLQFNKIVDTSIVNTPTTSDNDVIMYKYIAVDLDPARPSGISSTDEELEEADEIRKIVEAHMIEQGFRTYIRAFSGNGYHLLFPYGAENNSSTVETVRNYLKSLDDLFSNDSCKVDITNFNPSRVLKLYGTLAQKGRNTTERPHRMSRILEVVHEEED